MIENYLLQFGESMGITGLKFGQTGCLRFEVENAGTIYLERVEEEIFFYILKDFNLLNLPYSYYKEALVMTANQETYSFLIHPIAKENNLLGFFLRLPELSCDLPMLNKVFNFLMQLVQTLETRAQEAIKQAFNPLK
ncbi:MAG: hypothetical protein LBD69_04115 [Puniceicoccales bacterium]|jgi:type III secretion system chaperone SycN|nr:hypothetical protein [Puniceicoccales bacterium]